MAPQPFYAYSSFNKRGGKTHPRVARMRNRILDMWADMVSVDTIAEICDIATDTVRAYVRSGKRRGDPRATRPRGVNRRILRANQRRRQIDQMHDAGFPASEIAERLGCTVRLVQLRTKEGRNA